MGTTSAKCFATRGLASVLALAGALLLGGCQLFSDDADREVYRVVERRQRESLGATHDTKIARGGRSGTRNTDYDFVPNRLDDDVPESFRTVASRPAPSTQESGSPTSAPTTAPTTQAASRPTRLLTLEESLVYAFKHSREFQTAKELLYLAALDLTLERHMWTPRFFGNLGANYTGLQSLLTAADGVTTSYEPDQAMTAVGQVGVRQKLPYGGEVVARVVDTLVRDVENHVSTGQTGQAILEANLPLLRGAGPAAYESRFQAERNLIYAIRTFEGFRRNLVVDLAGDYLALQGQRQAIDNAQQSIDSLDNTRRRAEALWRTGRRIYLDVQRAEQDRLFAINNKYAATERYETALDQFKIRIGMPTETPIDVEMPLEPTSDAPPATTRPFEATLQMPAVTEEEAFRTAMQYRLDLKNDLDRIGDAERGIAVAENDLLPDLRATSSVLFNTNPAVESFHDYNDEHTVYKAGVTLELPFDRMAERNALRKAQISKSRAERDYEDAKETMAMQVRRAMRRVQQEMDALRILILARNTALERRRFAEIRLATKGDISNRDVVDAENALFQARNQLAAAQASLGLAILQFRRDTGTLRVDDDGRWTIVSTEPR